MTKPYRKDGQYRPNSPQRFFNKPAPQQYSNTPSNTTNSAETEQTVAPLLPGIKPVLELLEATPERIDCVFLRKGRHGPDADRVIDLCKEHRVRFSLLESSSFARIYEGKSQGVVARLFETGYADYETLLDTTMDAPLPLLLALDQVQDPGNAGTLARTMYALGGAGLVIPKHNGVYLGAAASKIAAGALEQLPVSKVGNLGSAIDAAKKIGFTIYGAAYEEDTPAQQDKPTNNKHAENRNLNVFTFTPRFPAILVLGAEESGMRTGMEKRCDFLLSIPMLRKFDSLNVAQAGAIIIGEFSKHKS